MRKCVVKDATFAESRVTPCEIARTAAEGWKLDEMEERMDKTG